MATVFHCSPTERRLQLVACVLASFFSLEVMAAKRGCCCNCLRPCEDSPKNFDWSADKGPMVVRAFPRDDADADEEVTAQHLPPAKLNPAQALDFRCNQPVSARDPPTSNEHETNGMAEN
eukprot:6470444-Amphidinium_carterae.1